ncbi:hypothetical protein [Nostoc punctiforme]|uniref:hypothetical protein n=1 Tax=Nostoc punctiforme TaxID=272131 RepID=UPI003CC8CD10
MVLVFAHEGGAEQDNRNFRAVGRCLQQRRSGAVTNANCRLCGITREVFADAASNRRRTLSH